MEPSYLGYYLKCCGSARPKLVWAIHAWSQVVGKMYYVNAIDGSMVDSVQTSMN